jgi:hypothetical protein
VWIITYFRIYNLYSSPNIIRVKKSKRMRWARHVAHMGEMRNVYRIFIGNMKERNHSGEEVGGRIILN